MPLLVDWFGRLTTFMRERFNRPAMPAPASLHFREIGARPQLASSVESAQHEADLNVVITTCNRVEQLDRLLDQLMHSLQRRCLLQRVRFLILEDHAQSDYSGLYNRRRDQLGDRLVWLQSCERMGKSGYFRTYQAAFSYLGRWHVPHVLFIQDDLEVPDDFVERALALHGSLLAERPGVARPIVLNLYASDDDEPEGRWVDFSREDHKTLPVRRTQWFDLNAYLVNREVLELLRFSIVPIHPSRWQRDPQLSSGVGRQLTRRLSRRAEIYQCFPPLAFHGSTESVMNPEARLQRSLDNRHLRASDLDPRPDELILASPDQPSSCRDSK